MWTLYEGDCIEVMKQLLDNSVDAVITDPPYELGFMGKKWDSTGITYNVDMWREVLRVLKPGGRLLSFGGTRTYHRMACAIEDAGFEICDQIQWLYGSGFPKSMDIGKVIGKTASATPDAQQWDGWGTALKPANEPICMARKPLSESTIVKNVLKWGTGGLNISGCRIPVKADDMSDPTDVVPHGRFPANVLIDETIAAMLDAQNGISKRRHRRKGTGKPYDGLNGDSAFKQKQPKWHDFGDPGGVSRFFYVAKASKSERGKGNTHPTVKPIKLMRYLVRLITPPGGIVLDPFAGSGTTLIAAEQEGFNSIGIEMNPEYCDTIRRRMDNQKEEQSDE
jgi:DNA modification methylase